MCVFIFKILFVYLCILILFVLIFVFTFEMESESVKLGVKGDGSDLGEVRRKNDDHIICKKLKKERNIFCYFSIPFIHCSLDKEHNSYST